MSSPQVDICVLCHNRSDVTARFLIYLVDHLSGVDATIHILDNNSVDGTWTLLRWFKANTRRWVPWARHKGLKVKIYRSPKNLGFAGGNNYLAAKGKAEYVCFINNDAFPEYPIWLWTLTSMLRGDEFGSVGAVAPISDNVMGIQHRVWSDKFPYLWHRAQCLSGFCLVMRRKVFEEIGRWDDDFMNGDEDVDLSWRLRQSGYALIVRRDVFVHHECSQSLAPWCALRKESIRQHFEKTRMQLIEKHGSQCQNDMGFWEHLDRPVEEWAEMGVMPNGEYFAPPGGHADQARIIAAGAVSAGGPRRILQARKLHSASSSGEEAGIAAGTETGKLHSVGCREWEYHLGPEGGGFAYAAFPKGSDCPLRRCATCETEAGQAQEVPVAG